MSDDDPVSPILRANTEPRVLCSTAEEIQAALSLSRAGFPVRVFEQADELKEIGAGIQLGPNVFRMFDVLGIHDAVAKHSVFPDRYQVMDAVTGEALS